MRRPRGRKGKYMGNHTFQQRMAQDVVRQGIA
jgi:hypothetical protein